MASRLYGTTRRLYVQVVWALSRLRVCEVSSPTTAVLVALYVSGLILLDVRPTQTRVTRFLPGRCHDALNRLLRVMPLSTRSLMGLAIIWVKALGREGYLVLDDVIVEKAFAKRLPWAAWTYSWSKKRKVYGLHIVVILWCSFDGAWRIPVAFRLLRPKRSISKARYRTRVELAEEMLREMVAAGLPIGYIVFDNHYTAGWFTKTAGRLGLIWQGSLDPRTIVVWRGCRQAVGSLPEQLHLKWRQEFRLRAVALTVYAPKYGTVRLVVTRNRFGNLEYLVSNDLAADMSQIMRRKRRRWSVETIFRDTKQYAGLESCQCWADAAMVRHVAMVLTTFTVLQMLRVHPGETVAAVKERWQMEAIRNQEAPPAPLKACPAHLRMTA